MKFTFPQGIHIPPNKNLSKEIPLKEIPAPDKVYISLSQHIGKPSESIVAPQQKVFCGSLIAKASSQFSANVYSSVSGIVLGEEMRITANGSMAKHIIIENDHKYETIYLPELDLYNLSAEDIIERVKLAGVVGMGGASFPTHIKLCPSQEVDTLIINGAECEPYITCDYRLMLERPQGIINGVDLIMRALKIKKAIIGIEDNKMDAVEILQKHATTGISVVAVKEKYPQGSEKQLIYALTKRKVPAGSLPAVVGVVMDNVHTALSVYQAVELKLPCYKRVVTISGKGVEQPANFIVPTGTTYQHLYNLCSIENDKGEIDGEKIVENGQNKESEICKVISGGPMMGFCQQNLEATVNKGTSAILFLTESEVNNEKPTQCINCARCVKACPMNLMPMFLDAYAEIDDFDSSKKFGVLNCIECGSCAYVCPAKRAIVQSVRHTKKALRERGE